MIKRILISLAIGAGLITAVYADGGHKGNGNHGANGNNASSTSISTKVLKKSTINEKTSDTQEVSGKARN